MAIDRVKHPPMSKEDRAKQFMPFAALTGFTSVIKIKEKVVLERIELSEDQYKELDTIIHSLKVRDIIKIIFFEKGEYIEIKGMVSKIDFDLNYIIVVDKKIKFMDIRKITIDE